MLLELAFLARQLWANVEQLAEMVRASGLRLCDQEAFPEVFLAPCGFPCALARDLTHTRVADVAC